MASPDPEPFVMLEHPSNHSLSPDYVSINSGKRADIGVPLTAKLRQLYPTLNLTVTPASNCPLIPFAAAGFAQATLDSETEPPVRWRGYVPDTRTGGQGRLGDAFFYAKYAYFWAGFDFIVYTIGTGSQTVNYILREPDSANGEDTLSRCAVTDTLMLAVVKAAIGNADEYVWVYDGFWTRSQELWNQVQKASWDKVILEDSKKKAIKSVTSFFDSKEAYRRYGVPWRRGLIFYGPPGNGKTISLKALMHQLSSRKDPVPTLYIKSAPFTRQIRVVFEKARQMSPCLLVMEDIETIVTQQTRSYFFNEVDGLENNQGILMIATTNYLDKLDPGLASRPSRFDRKYKFPIPSLAERESYARFWKEKLAKSNKNIEFPDKLCPAIAEITNDFSFAFLQEVFVAALLSLARQEVVRLSSDDGDGEMVVEKKERGGDDPLDEFELWIAIKESVRILRKDLEDGDDKEDPGATAGKDSRSIFKAQLSTEPRTQVGTCVRSVRNNTSGSLTHRDRGGASCLPAFGEVDMDSTEGSSNDTRRFWKYSSAETPKLDFKAQGGEATTEDLAGVGVVKRPSITEGAFEWN